MKRSRTILEIIAAVGLFVWGFSVGSTAERTSNKCDAVSAYYQGMSDSIELVEKYVPRGSFPEMRVVYKGKKYRTIQ